MISKILRFFLKLVLGIFAAVFALSLLAAALIVVVLSVLKSLITGRKPAPAMVFGRFQRYSPQGMWPGGPAQGNAANQRAGDVVDVEVREVRDDKRLP
ncbi:hypothetical protein SAMN05216350_11710 [Polaromonas sp. YR568]|uniref:hypothetical protein n=1 Tax=Polaromonas sp. YR568 TaxID=1855301 RepID=UPI0008EFA441|nr:hypothetical protein SAMN05216350_11710 [Polaromonas sp. YR568]